MPYPINQAGHSGLSLQVTVKELPNPRCIIGNTSLWLFVMGQDQVRIV